MSIEPRHLSYIYLHYLTEDITLVAMPTALNTNEISLTSRDKVNVDTGLQIGEKLMRRYELSWPNGFNVTISKEVKTMQLMKKHISVGTVKVYDTSLIYSRIIGLQASGRKLNLDDVLKYKLSPVPIAMFDSSGDMRVAKAKSTLKRQLQVEATMRHVSKNSSLIIDGSAMLWVISWPTNGKVQDYVDTVVSWVLGKLKESDLWLMIFDRYMEYSIKDNTRNTRQKGAS